MNERMNERIKELIGQATTSEKGPPILNGYTSYNSEIILFNKERFAELIVRECLNIIGEENAELIVRECLNIIGEEKCEVEVSNNLAPLETLWSVECAIKENFGVEE